MKALSLFAVLLFSFALIPAHAITAAKRHPASTKKVQVKKPQKVVKRSKSYRKTQKDINEAVSEVFEGGKDEPSNEPTIDVGEFELPQ